MANKIPSDASQLRLRPGDQLLDAPELKSLELVGRLADPGIVDRAPPRAALRRYRPGDLLCRQGETAATAFYLLTASDVATLRERQLKRRRSVADDSELQGDLDWARQRIADTAPPPGRQLAAAVLLDQRQEQEPPGFFSKLMGASSAAAKRPAAIPIDAPSDIDAATGVGPLYEGDLFGERSCLQQTPRSASVVATTDCLALEFLGGFLKTLRSDAGFRRRQDESYRTRLLASHLRRADLFAGLDAAALDRIAASAEMVSVEPGRILGEEGAAADSLYVVRNGDVQAIADASLVIREDDISDWTAFCRELLVDSQTPGEGSP
ncbi:cyclic nucleotide-binding domain-containing protein [Lignipirellula cremea]|uniref:Cyclic nucleotide-binding domain protein n=1 Tax=Lignipirellula cremea TaxID=2528010 RepID=A0A518DQ83_9BACT|nr:cyclic nucleotide-binding domain-containing protein [Lignipirellula cremea]QDU93988.1 Cyclic nucleotide-binding domain protein [Lignipirellula cremea]